MRVIFFIIPVIIAAISVLKQPLCTSPLGSKAEMKFETFVKLLLLNESYESALKWISTDDIPKCVWQSFDSRPTVKTSKVFRPKTFLKLDLAEWQLCCCCFFFREKKLDFCKTFYAFYSNEFSLPNSIQRCLHLISASPLNVLIGGRKH